MNDGTEWGNGAQILSAAVAAVALIVSIVSILRQRNDKAIEDIKSSQTKMEASFEADMKALREDDGRQFERIDKIEANLARVEADVRHLPTRDEVHRIDVKITEIGTRIEARFEALADKMDLVIAQNERAQDRLAEREDRSK